MRESDFEEFADVVDAVCSLISRGNYAPNATNTALWFQALSAYDLSVIRLGLSAHVKDPQRGKFVPTPADVIAQIDILMEDGRPGSEEAWAMVPHDERQTAVWTTEMAEAYGAASPLLAAGDTVAARMTFKEVYTKVIARSKAGGKAAVWQLTLGSDVEQRKRVVQAALEAGRISAATAEDACPKIGNSLSKLLLTAPESKRTKVQEIQRGLDAIVEAWRGECADPKAWVRDLQQREARGEALTMGQKDMLRDATLYDAPVGTKALADFQPIPADVLPPGLRAQLAHERELKDAA